VGSNEVRAVGIVSAGNGAQMAYQDFMTAVRDFGITTIG